MSPPTVSVIIPTFEAPHFLVMTIETVLAQTFSNFELIVVDDGSGPSTQAVLEPYRHRLHYIRKENGGPASARNVGIKTAGGELLAFCDHDDLWYPEKLARHVERHRSDPGLGLTFSQVVPFYEDGRTRPVQPSSQAREVEENAFLTLIREHVIVTSSAVVMGRETFGCAGPFDESLRVADDTEYWFRLARLVRFGFIAEPLVRYRLHPRNLHCLCHALADRERMRIYERLHACSQGLPLEVQHAIVARRARHLLSFARRCRREGRFSQASALLREAARLVPFSPRVRRHQLVNWIRDASRSWAPTRPR